MAGLIRIVVATPYLAFLAVAITVLTIYKFSTYDKRRRSLPPMVPAWPLINHTFIQMQDDMPPILREWGTKYGELFRTRAGTTDFIWLNSKEAVKELFDRRSAIYSSRQPMPMAFDCATYASKSPPALIGADCQWKRGKEDNFRSVWEDVAGLASRIP